MNTETQKQPENAAGSGEASVVERLVMRTKRDALIMANARRLIKAHKRTSNGRLYMELFGTGFTTARIICNQMGLDPESNVTSYNEMIKAIDA